MRSFLITLMTLLTFYLLTGCAPQTDDDATVTATSTRPRNPAGSVAATMISPVTH